MSSREAVSWTERGAALGLPEGPAPADPHESGGGVVAHDFNGDGRRDLLLSWERAPPVLAWGGPDGFWTEQLRLMDDLLQPSLVDVDADGDLDVLYGSQSMSM